MADSFTPVDVTGLSSGVSSIPVGTYGATCVLTTTGGVKCWGNNLHGGLGDGTKENRSTPVDVSGLSSGVIAVSTSGFHACALTSTGGVKCWGDNSEGQLGDGSKTDRLTPVDVAELTTGVIAVSAGGSHTCVITQDGGVKCWGNNTGGFLGNATTTSSTTPVDVIGMSSDATDIFSGALHSCAINASGGVKCWGKNSFGELGDGTIIDRYTTPVDVINLSADVKYISAGRTHTCTVTTSGEVKCWGENVFGQLGNNSTNNSPLPVAVSISGVESETVSAGGGHTCLYTTNDIVKCWGYNSKGELGDGTTIHRHSPVDIVEF